VYSGHRSGRAWVSAGSVKPTHVHRRTFNRSGRIWPKTIERICRASRSSQLSRSHRASRSCRPSRCRRRPSSIEGRIREEERRGSERWVSDMIEEEEINKQELQVGFKKKKKDRKTEKRKDKKENRKKKNVTDSFF
jgi:hypothetical protein